MRTDDYKVILDSLPSTGVYVIREDNHRILYYNRCIKEVMPRIEIGMVCDEVWAGSCAHCPLQYIKDKKECRTINYDNPFGDAVDVTAVRTIWEKKTKAFILTITPHIEVANYTFYKIIRGNLTDNTYEIVKIDKRELEKIGELPDTLSEYMKRFGESGVVFEEDRRRFWEFSKLEYLSAELRGGKTMVSCNYRRKVGEKYRWYSLEVVPDYQYTNDRQSVMIYAKDVHDAYQEGLERQEISIENQERLAAIIRSQYRIMNTVYLDTGMSERVFLSKAGNLDWSITGDYEEIIQKTFGENVYEEDREHFFHMFSLARLRKKAEKVQHFREEVCQYRLKDDVLTWVEEHIYYIRQKDNVIVNILSRDITEEKLLEERTSQERQERAVIIQSLSSLFFSSYYVNLEENISQTVSQSEEVGEVLGNKRNYMEAIQTYARIFVHPEDQEEYLTTFARENLIKTLTKEHPFVAVEYRKTDGGYAAVEKSWIRATVILADMGEDGAKTALYVAQDVTESKEKEEHARKVLVEACESATQANAAKSDFMSRMSHDIRTPMNAIIGMTTIAGAHLDEQERVKDCLNKITVSSRHLLSLINEVLDMSKIESGKISLSEKNFNLSDLIQNLIMMVRSSAKEKQHTLEFHILNVEHEDVIGDVVRLQQVFTNILGNSIKYTPPGGKLELEISEKFSQVYGYGCYEFVFRDNGIGMDEAFLKKIFEPFSRAEDSRVSKIEGTGLGMAITQNIVHLMNGNIQVESEKNKGSQFTVTIFLKQQHTIEPNMESFAGYKVLVADTDICAAEAACELINKMGMNASWVPGGYAALERIHGMSQDNEYFAVFLAWRMSDLNGVETARRIRAQKGTENIHIVLTSYDLSSVEEEAREAGVDEFISKPLFKSRLIYLFQRLAGIEDEIEVLSGKDILDASFEGCRVLLAEDNELNREIAIEIIGSTKVEMEVAENGKEAFEMYIKKDVGYYDLIFMDIQMPVMNGHEASRAIRNSGKADAQTIPIVAMTANAFAEDAIESQKAGMNEHISKPLDLKCLMECMGRWLT